MTKVRSRQSLLVTANCQKRYLILKNSGFVNKDRLTLITSVYLTIKLSGGFKSYHFPNHFPISSLNLIHQCTPDVSLLLNHAKISVALLSQFPMMDRVYQLSK